MEHYLAEWVGNGDDATGGSYTPPTFQSSFSAIDFRPTSLVNDGKCVVAVPERDADVEKSGAVYLGPDLDDVAGGKALMRGMGLNYRGPGDPTIRDALVDLFVEHSTPPEDRSRWNGLVAGVSGGRGDPSRADIVLGGEVVASIPNVSGGALNWDHFTDADATDLTAHTPDSGFTWTVFSGTTPKINSNQCRPSGTSLVHAAGGDNASDNNYAEAYFAACSTGTSKIGVLARVNTVNPDFYRARYTDPSNISLMKVVSGTATTLASASRTFAAETVRIVANGTNIAAYYLGGTPVTLSAVDGEVTVGKACGIYFDAYTSVTQTVLDDFLYNDYGVSAPTPRPRGRLIVPAYARR